MPRIAVTKLTPGKYELYPAWLRRVDPTLDVVDLRAAGDVRAALAQCDGLLLPGGADVDPEFYDRPDQRDACTIDRARDELEFEALHAALDGNLPVLGVCRGLQLGNVALGGTLLVDLPSIGLEGHGTVDGRDAVHPVLVRPDSFLAEVVGAREGTVNSSHHQGAGLLAPLLQVSAQSPDGVAEALEWIEPAGKPWLLLVQWHPERMGDLDDPYSRNVAEAFLRAARGTPTT
jgi:putative glutamine amidotransferase